MSPSLDHAMPTPAPPGASRSSELSRTVALILAGTLGIFGGHRYYAGRTNSALWMTITLGGLGLWCLYDVILIAAGEFRDGEGRKISRWSANDLDYPDSQALRQEVEALRDDVAELAERLDFAERMLARHPEAPADLLARGDGPTR